MKIKAKTLTYTLKVKKKDFLGLLESVKFGGVEKEDTLTLESNGDAMNVEIIIV